MYHSYVLTTFVDLFKVHYARKCAWDCQGPKQVFQIHVVGLQYPLEFPVGVKIRFHESTIRC